MAFGMLLCWSCETISCDVTLEGSAALCSNITRSAPPLLPRRRVIIVVMIDLSWQAVHRRERPHPVCARPWCHRISAWAGHRVAVRAVGSGGCWIRWQSPASRRRALVPGGGRQRRTRLSTSLALGFGRRISHNQDLVAGGVAGAPGAAEDGGRAAGACGGGAAEELAPRCRRQGVPDGHPVRPRPRCKPRHPLRCTIFVAASSLEGARRLTWCGSPRDGSPAGCCRYLPRSGCLRKRLHEPERGQCSANLIPS